MKAALPPRTTALVGLWITSESLPKFGGIFAILSLSQKKKKPGISRASAPPSLLQSVLMRAGIWLELHWTLDGLACPTVSCLPAWGMCT